MTPKHPSTPTSDVAGIRQTIRALLAAGYTLDSVDNGYEEPVTTEDQAVEEATASDSAWLYVKNPDGKVSGVFFVLGNDPEEVICDFHVSLEHVIGPLTEHWTDHWH